MTSLQIFLTAFFGSWALLLLVGLLLLVWEIRPRKKSNNGGSK